MVISKSKTTKIHGKIVEMFQLTPDKPTPYGKVARLACGLSRGNRARQTSSVPMKFVRRVTSACSEKVAVDAT